MSGTEIGRAIKRRRVARRWRLVDLARGIGCSAAAISRWESGERMPSAYWVRRLEAALGYRLGSLAMRLRPQKGNAWTDGSETAPRGTPTR